MWIKYCLSLGLIFSLFVASEAYRIQSYYCASELQALLPVYSE